MAILRLGSMHRRCAAVNRGLDRRSLRGIAISMCIVFAMETSGCHRWTDLPKPRDQSQTELDADAYVNLQGQKVRLRQGEVVRIVDVQRVTYPMLEGVETDSQGQRQPVVLDLRDVDQLEVSSDSPVRTSFLAIGIVAVAVVGGGLLLLCAKLGCH